MAPPRAHPPTTDPTVDLDLTQGIHSRISLQAETMIKDRAQKSGLKPSTWVRVTLYKALGLIKD